MQYLYAELHIGSNINIIEFFEPAVWRSADCPPTYDVKLVFPKISFNSWSTLVDGYLVDKNDVIFSFSSTFKCRRQKQKYLFSNPLFRIVCSVFA